MILCTSPVPPFFPLVARGCPDEHSPKCAVTNLPHVCSISICSAMLTLWLKPAKAMGGPPQFAITLLLIMSFTSSSTFLYRRSDARPGLSNLLHTSGVAGSPPLLRTNLLRLLLQSAQRTPRSTAAADVGIASPEMRKKGFG